MDRIDFLNSLEFDDQASFDQEIQSVASDLLIAV